MSKTRPKPIGPPIVGRSRRPSILKPTVEKATPSAKVRVVREPDWVAWTNDGSRQLAQASTLEEARDAARALGEMDPILEPAQTSARLA